MNCEIYMKLWFVNVVLIEDLCLMVMFVTVYQGSLKTGGPGRSAAVSHTAFIGDISDGGVMDGSRAARQVRQWHGWVYFGVMMNI